MAISKKSIKHSGVYLTKKIAQDINRTQPRSKLATKATKVRKQQAIVADPIADLIAQALAEGRLLARDSKGRPKNPPRLPSEFMNTYVHPDDVNKILAEAGYLEKWEPRPVYPRHSKILTPAQRAEKFGWHNVIREEATRYFIEVYEATGQKTNMSQLAVHIRGWSLLNQINSKRGNPPDQGTIRNLLRPPGWIRPK